MPKTLLPENGRATQTLAPAKMVSVKNILLLLHFNDFNGFDDSFIAPVFRRERENGDRTQARIELFGVYET